MLRFKNKAHGAERGAAAIIFAVALPILLMMTAMVVDLGYAYYSKQDLQDTLDLAALAAARELDGGTGQRQAARVAAEMVVVDNGFTAQDIQSITFGDYSRSRPLGSRFQAEGGAATSINAVQIRGKHVSPGFFSAIISDDPLDVSAVSTARTSGRYATVKIGSGLAGLENGLLNALLGALLGANVNLTALDYNGLVNANVDLLSFLDAYAVRVGLAAGDYDGLLSADASVLGIIGLVADAAHNAAGGNQSALDLGLGLGDAFPGLSKLPLLNLQDVNVKLGDLLGVGLGTVDAGLEVPVNVFDLVMAGIMVASTQSNATGQHAAGVSLDTFLGATLDVSIVEMPQPPTGYRVITPEDIASGDNLLRTAQIRVLLQVDWQGALSGVFSVVNGLLDIVQLLGIDIDLLPTYGPHANENLSIGVSVAPAQVRVTELGCEASAVADRYVGMDIDTGLLSGHIGQIDREDFLSNNAAAHADPFRVVGVEYNLWGLVQPPVNLLSLDLGVNLPVGAPTRSVDLTGGDLLDADTFPDIHALFEQPGHRPDNEDFPSGVSVESSQLLTTLADGLKEKLGLQLTGVLGGLVQAVVNLVLAIVDVLLGLLTPILDALVDLLLDLLGISVGKADVAVIGLECGTPRLVSE